MNTSSFSIRRTAVTALLQIAIAAVVALLVMGWLHIPDANLAEVSASIFVALIIAAVVGVSEAAVASRLTSGTVTRRRLLIGAVAILIAITLLYAFSLIIEHFSANDGLYAGYLNSRFPSSLRSVFSFEHLLVWLGWIWIALRWIVAGLLTPAAFACAACDAPAASTLAIYRSVKYWLALLLLTITGWVIADALLNWTPGHGLYVELPSLILRLLLVTTLNAAAFAWLLQTMASVILSRYPAGTGDPAISHPRTADIP